MIHDAHGLKWLEASHGIYLERDWYDEGPHGDNWTYLDPRSLCIVHFRPSEGTQTPCKDATIVAGPFPNLTVAKAAYLVLYGR